MMGLHPLVTDRQTVDRGTVDHHVDDQENGWCRVRRKHAVMVAEAFKSGGSQYPSAVEEATSGSG